MMHRDAVDNDALDAGLGIESKVAYAAVLQVVTGVTISDMLRRFHWRNSHEA
jgi:hypothetical protein